MPATLETFGHVVTMRKHRHEWKYTTRANAKPIGTNRRAFCLPNNGKGVHPHKLRRTFAVTCLRGGMDVYTLARLMGHSDIATLRHYVASIGDELQAAHGKVSPVDRMLKR